MRKSRCNEEQIIGVLREQESGATTAEEVCRRHGIAAISCPATPLADVNANRPWPSG